MFIFLFLIIFLVSQRSLQDLSSPTKDRIHSLISESEGS